MGTCLRGPLGAVPAFSQGRQIARWVGVEADGFASIRGRAGNPVQARAHRSRRIGIWFDGPRAATRRLGEGVRSGPCRARTCLRVVAHGDARRRLWTRDSFEQGVERAAWAWRGADEPS